ncbi:MAG TPA: hypothetical protein VF756_04630 [Thermoanaerobaculia bacterium]
MSEGEVFVLIGCAIVGFVIWLGWLIRIVSVSRRHSRFADRWLLLAAPLLCAALLYGVLRRFASFDVREDPVFLFFYMVMGAAWVGLAAQFLSLFGVSVRDDVLERGNRAAAVAIAGALMGITFCFAGGNIGDGPGWWVVVFCAALSTGTLLLLWIFLDRTTGLADTVTIDRDPAAGLRLAGFFLGAGLILGRSVAGDWESGAATVRDFVITGWPALALWLVAVWLEPRLRPSPEEAHRPLLSHGLLPALLYAGGGYLAAMQAGPWT